MKSTIALFASSRRNGNTGQLMDAVARNTGITVVDLGDKNISTYDYQHRNRGDDFEALLDYVLGFEQIIFASPVYWYSLSPAMKVFMDRLSDLLDLPDLLDKGRQLRGKRAFILSTSIQTEVSAHFVGALRETFEYLGIHYGGCLHADCKDGYAADNCTADIQRFVVALKAAA